MTFIEWWQKLGIFHGRDTVSGLIEPMAFAALTWEAAQPKWQPIETAPMGKRVLVKRFGHEPEIRRIVKDIEGDIVAIRDCGMRVLLSVFDAYMELPKQPMHWMTLPHRPGEQ